MLQSRCCGEPLGPSPELFLFFRLYFHVRPLVCVIIICLDVLRLRIDGLGGLRMPLRDAFSRSGCVFVADADHKPVPVG